MHQSRGRPRSRVVGERILDAALELLREKGPAALNIDAVAARSGVARTTIYRRHPDRRSLIAAALDRLVEVSTPAPHLPMEEKLRWVLEEVRRLVEERLGRGGTAALIADSDPEFTTALRRVLQDRLETLGADVQVDVDSGALDPGVDPGALAGLLLGAYLGEALLHGQARDGWADSTVTLLLRGAELRPPGAPGAGPHPRRGDRT
jgi:AcrR family transcriptional regulator